MTNLDEMRLGIEAMLDPAAAHIILEIENIVERRHQVPGVLRLRPALLTQFHDPIQHFSRAVQATTSPQRSGSGLLRKRSRTSRMEGKP
jgi:hypothetical protein